MVRRFERWDCIYAGQAIRRAHRETRLTEFDLPLDWTEQHKLLAG
jgi:hypothetical protein